MNAFKTTAKMPLAVDFLEVVDQRVVNGCRFNVTAATTSVALRELLRLAGAVMQRIGLQLQMASGAEVAKAARSLLKAKAITRAAYLKFLAQTKAAMGQSIDGFLAEPGNDKGLQIAAAWQALQKAADAKDFGNTFANHTTLLNKLDVATTLLQKANRP
jgi:hypothetical protein